MTTTEDTLWKRYRRKKSTTNRNALVVHYLPLLKKHAFLMLKRLDPSVQYDDVFSAGCVGLIKAIEAFDPKQSKFTTYLTVRVRGEILDWARGADNQSRTVRKFETLKRRVTDRLDECPTDCELANRMGLNVSRYQKLSRLSRHGILISTDGKADDGCRPMEWEDKHTSSPDFNISLEWLKNSLGYFSAKEKVAFFDTYAHGLSCQDAGKMLGYSESRISQIRKAVMDKVRLKCGVDIS